MDPPIRTPLVEFHDYKLHRLSGPFRSLTPEQRPTIPGHMSLFSGQRFGSFLPEIDNT
ncbi:hypothetical protein BGZ91_009661, partial [Linnemannia elongata]